MAKILIPIPDHDFDLTEVAVPWKRFKEAGHQVVFATEKGKVGETDPLLITGVLFGQLGAKKPAIAIYREMQESEEFMNPIRWDEINVDDFDMLHLPGGHAKGIRQYLESKLLPGKILEFFGQNKAVGAICHGPILLARTIDPATGKSIIADKKVTALTKQLEKIAYYITAWKLGDYYRTYPTYTQDEMTQSMNDKSNFSKGALNIYKPHVEVDGKLVTARWPEDVELYVETLLEML